MFGDSCKKIVANIYFLNNLLREVIVGQNSSKFATNIDGVWNKAELPGLEHRDINILNISFIRVDILVSRSQIFTAESKDRVAI